MSIYKIPAFLVGWVERTAPLISKEGWRELEAFVQGRSDEDRSVVSVRDARALLAYRLEVAGSLTDAEVQRLEYAIDPKLTVEDSVIWPSEDPEYASSLISIRAVTGAHDLRMYKATPWGHELMRIRKMSEVDYWVEEEAKKLTSEEWQHQEYLADPNNAERNPTWHRYAARARARLTYRDKVAAELPALDWQAIDLWLAADQDEPPGLLSKRGWTLDFARELKRVRPKPDLREAIVKYIATHLEYEPMAMYPICQDPYGILKLIEDDGVAAEQIDAWMVEAQDAEREARKK